MAKGLLHRRRMMQASGGMDYIQDGLVLWLDGIEKHIELGGWLDLAGSRLFTIHGAVARDDCFFFSDAYCSFNDLKYNRYDVTIEVVVKKQRTGWMSIFVTNGDYTNYRTPAAIRFESDTTIGFDAITDSPIREPLFVSPIPILDHRCTISAKSDMVVINGQDCTRGNNGAYSSQGNCVVGGRWWQNSFFSTGRFYGEICCVRMYYRLLSRDEMLHNQRVDNIRFNLGLTL